ncbi:MAG: YicC family protein [Alphaproteobacteria bacterium]|nr:YicC family protein [Alphaproteobacteria bacterium]
MALVSMTGFSEVQGGLDGARWRWEVKSTNGRGLDLRLRLPPGLEGLEPAARALAAERFRRGSIQATLTLETQESGRGFRVDPVALAAAVKIAKEIARDTGLESARVDGILALKGIVIQDETTSPDLAIRSERLAAILGTLGEAFDSLSSARKAEGKRLTEILAALMREIARLTEEAAQSAAVQPALIRKKITAQLAEMLTGSTIAEDRMAQEIALVALRSDVREELDRLRAHVSEARLLLGSSDPVGRKLDFLAQEFNREANTLCSKSSDIALTRTGLGLKAAIDQFREQAQNVE